MAFTTRMVTGSIITSYMDFSTIWVHIISSNSCHAIMPPNAYVMSRMKVASGGRHFSARAIWSTVVGETADSLIFFPVAFGGIIAWRELLVMMCIQILLKSMYEVLILPVTIRVVKAIKRIDGSDVYDEGISYKVWKIGDI